MRPVTDRSRAPRLIVLAAAALVYAWLLTHGSLDFFGAEPFGLTFNSMLAHMLDGQWSVDPAAIGFEAFLRDGESYAYFGPFPAMLRLPLALLPHWQTLHVERLSCWLAIMLGITAQAQAITTSLAGDEATVQPIAPPLLLVCAFSGAPMLLAFRGAPIYHEALLWAWALAMLFLALALPGIRGRNPVGSRLLCALASCAGLCLLTRSTTGAGLCLAIGVVLLRELVRFRHAVPAVITRELWAPCCILGLSLALTGLVNQGRWGSPFIFADLHLQTIVLDEFPDRLARLDRYGLFDWRRLPTGLLYFVAPIWTDGLERLFPLTARLVDMYDSIERPASSILLTDPAWCFLSMLGVATIVRHRAARSEALLATSLTLAPFLMLIAWTVVFRYRVEFAPLLLALACIALRHGVPGWARRAIPILCFAQIGSTTMAGWSYASQPFGPTPGYSALSLSCTFSPASCIEPP